MEVAWTKHRSFNDLVRNSWANGPTLVTDYNQKMQDIRKQMINWKNTVFRSIKNLIRNTRNRLLQLKGDPINQAHIDEEKELEQKLNWLESIDEIYWHQKAKVYWHNSGDKCSMFFHTKVPN